MSLHRYLCLVIVIFLLFITVPAYKNQALYTRFVDEDYNFAIGKYLAKGEILYDDIITNHLPMTHLLSGLLQKREKPDTLAALIEKHRSVIANWSAIWAIVFALYFGAPGLLFVVIYELTRSHLFGNLFLAETFVAYPLVFLVGLITFRKFPLTNLEMFIAGVLFVFCVLTLGPLWPGIFFLYLVSWIKQWRSLQTSKAKSMILGLSGSLLIFLIVLPKVNIAGFFQYYILGNFSGMVPHSQAYWLNSIPQSFITPILSFTSPGSDDHLMLIKVLSGLLILNLGYIFWQKKFSLGLVIFMMLGLFNIRFIPPGANHANGFHLLPWYACLVMVASFLAIEPLKGNAPGVIKILNVGLLIVALFFSFRYAQQNLFTKKDAQKEYEVLFSTHSKIAQDIKDSKSPGETLFVYSDAWLVYWQADTNHLPKLFGYYTWMSGIPQLHAKILKAFSASPPTYLYCEGCKNTEFGPYLGKYSEVKGYEGKQNLFYYHSN